MLPKKDTDQYKSYIKTSAVGLEVGLSILLGCLAGYFFDKKFNSAPYGLLFGIFVGVLAAVRSLYQFSKKWLKDQNHLDPQ